MATVNLPGIGAVDKRVLYGVGGAAGLFIVWRYYQASSSAPTDPAADAVDAGADSSSVDTGDYAAGTYVPNNVNNSSGNYTPATDAILTDAEWASQSVDELAELGIDPAAAALALGKYLNGEGLTIAQREIVIRARALNGNPPQAGNLPMRTALPPTSRPAPTKPTGPTTNPVKPRYPSPTAAKVKIVTVRKGDTLGEIAQRNRSTVAKIRSLSSNAHLFDARHRNGALIFPGERVRVPV